jgi:hypothetical protein
MKRTGTVVSLHLHPVNPGEPFHAVPVFDVVADQGIAGNPRYFGRVSRSTGKPSRRQVSLIECEQVAEHAAALGLESIAPGAVRSNIETEGIDLVPLVGRRVRIGEAILHLYEPRDPCGKMDAVAPGLKQLMRDGKQGVMAEVIQSGRIQVGDAIEPLQAEGGTFPAVTGAPARRGGFHWNLRGRG